MFSLEKALSITLLGLGASCSSSIFTDYPEDAWFGLDAFEHGQFVSAADEFQQLNGTLESNEFLAYAESGMAYHVSGNLEAATNEWMKAVKVLDDYGDRPTISGRGLSEGALSMMLNDKATPYDGEGFEAVLLHGFLAWDFLRLNKLDDALVEVKRGYEFELFEEERFGTTYGMNRFARFVAALAKTSMANTTTPVSTWRALPRRSLTILRCNTPWRAWSVWNPVTVPKNALSPKSSWSLSVVGCRKKSLMS